MPDEKNEKKKPQVNYGYPSNSNAKKAEDAEETVEEAEKEIKNVQKIIKGSATAKKKGLGRKIVENFAGEEVHSVGQYVLFEVILPAAKAMISDAVSMGIDRMLFGDSKGKSIRGNSGKSSYTAYNRYGPSSSSSDRGPSRTISTRGRANHDFREITLETREEAIEVLDSLTELVDKYDTATVSDLYALVGITGNFTDNKWGWTDLRGADIRRNRDGYLLDLPRPEYLE